MVPSLALGEEPEKGCGSGDVRARMGESSSDRKGGQGARGEEFPWRDAKSQILPCQGLHSLLLLLYCSFQDLKERLFEKFAGTCSCVF